MKKLLLQVLLSLGAGAFSFSTYAVPASQVDEWQAFLLNNVVTAGEKTMPLSFHFPKEYFNNITDANLEERVMAYSGVDVYDAATWMIALALLDQTRPVQSYSQMLWGKKNFSNSTIQAINPGKPKGKDNKPTYSYLNLNTFYYAYNPAVPVDSVKPIDDQSFDSKPGIVPSHTSQTLSSQALSNQTRVNHSKTKQAEFDQFRFGQSQFSQQPFNQLTAGQSSDRPLAAFSADNAYNYRYIAPYWCSPDPKAMSLSGRKDQSQASDIHYCGMSASCPDGCVGWSDWRVITGEAAWSQMLAPVQTNAILEIPVTLTNPYIQMALDLVPAIEAMQSPIGAIYYRALEPAVADAIKSPSVISSENNFSTYAALSVLKSALQTITSANEKIQAARWVQRIDNILTQGYCYDYANARPLLDTVDWSNKSASGVITSGVNKGQCDGSIAHTITHPGIENFFKHYALAYINIDEANDDETIDDEAIDPFFFSGGSIALSASAKPPYSEDDFIFTPAVNGAKYGASIVFATDVQTWGVAALGLKKIHQLYSDGYEYRGVPDVHVAGGRFKKAVKLNPEDNAKPDKNHELAYRIWLTTRKNAGYFGAEYSSQNPPHTTVDSPLSANLGTPIMGVGYTHLPEHFDKSKVKNFNNAVASPEWSWGAVNMLRLISEQYDQLERARHGDNQNRNNQFSRAGDWLTFRNQMAVDAYAIEAGLLNAELYVCNSPSQNSPAQNNLCTIASNADSGVAMNYANVRYEIPFGWSSNPIPSLSSTAWAVMQAKNFNPFAYYGTSAANAKLSVSSPLVKQTTVTIINNVNHLIAVNAKPLDKSACVEAGGVAVIDGGGDEDVDSYCSLGAGVHIPVNGHKLLKVPEGTKQLYIPFQQDSTDNSSVWPIACVLTESQLGYLSTNPSNNKDSNSSNNTSNNPGNNLKDTYTIRAILTPNDEGMGMCIL